MNLDQLARQATQELLDVTGPDVAGRRSALSRTRRRRALGRAGALVGAASLVTVGVLLGTPSGDRDVRPAEPTGPLRNGALVTVDSSGTVVVLDGELPATAPGRVHPFSRIDFTMDGTRMMVQVPDGSLALIDLGTGETTSVGDCSTPWCDADLSPAGDVIALVAHDEDPRIELRPIDNGPVEHLSTPGTDIHSPIWSPDGSRLALTLVNEDVCPWYCDTAIGVIEADATGLRVLATAHTGKDQEVSWPAWSPDGARIAFTFSEGDNSGYDGVYVGSDILVVNADGGATDVLVPGGGLPSWRP